MLCIEGAYITSKFSELPRNTGIGSLITALRSISPTLVFNDFYISPRKPLCLMNAFIMLFKATSLIIVLPIKSVVVLPRVRVQSSEK